MEELSDILKKIASASTEGNTRQHQRPDDVDAREACELCGGRGWLSADVPPNHAEFGRLLSCECQLPRLEKERYARLLRYSNLADLNRFKFESLRQDIARDSQLEQYNVALEAAELYSTDPRDWIVFTGKYDPMKMKLAAAIGNRCLEHGHELLFMHVPDLLDHLRDSFTPTGDVAYSELFDQVRNTPLLILDDLGSHSTTPWAEEKLRQIINHRYNAELPTVITTTAELEEIDPYISSRIRSLGQSQIIEVGAKLLEKSREWGSIEPEMLKRMTFSNFDVNGNNSNTGQRTSLRVALKVSKEFAANPKNWLHLNGGNGSGKTHLAVAISGYLLKKGEPVFFAFVPELLDHLRYSFDPDSEVRYDHIFEKIKTAPFLVLDGFGQEHRSQWVREKLFQIIVHRQSAQLPTIITSKMDQRQDNTSLGSRINDTSMVNWVILDAPDYRRKGLGDE